MPTLVQAYKVEATAADLSTLTTATFTPSAGEVIVVTAIGENEFTKANVLSGGSLTWTSRYSSTAGSNCSTYCWTAVVPASPSSMSVSLTWTGTSGRHQMTVSRWSNAKLAASPAVGSATSNASCSATVTTAAAGSTVVWAAGDWNAVAPGTPTYRSSATALAAPTNASGTYTVYQAYQSAASAGAQTFGVSSPTGQKASMVGIEVQTAGSAPTVNAGADASVNQFSTFSRTATENDGGSTITSRSWTIQAGPSGVGTTLGTSATLSWTPTLPGTYTLRYSATNAIGTGTDDVVVTVSAVNFNVTAPLTLDTDVLGAKRAKGSPTAARLRLSAGASATRAASGAPAAPLRLIVTVVGEKINHVVATLRLSAFLSNTSGNGAGTATATMRLGAAATGVHRTAVARTAALRLTVARTVTSVRAGTPAAGVLHLAAALTGRKRGRGTPNAAVLRLSSPDPAVVHAGVGARAALLKLAASVGGTTRTGANAPVAVLLLRTSGTATRANGNHAFATPLFLSADANGEHIITEVAAALLAKAALTVPYELVCVARVPQTSGAPTLLQVDPIDWTGLSITQELSKPEQLAVGAKVSNLTEPVLQRLRNLSELATELWLYRQGKVIFAGPLLGWQVQGEAITLQAQGLLAYLKMMIVASDQVFKQVDQFTIATTLINQWQALDYGNFGIDTSNVGASGVLRDATYLAKELHNVQQRVLELGQRENGFDVAIDPASRKLRLSYPIQGVDRSSGEDAIVFDARNVTSPNIVCSAAPGDVASEAFGTGTGQATIYSTKSNLVRRAQYGRTAVSATFDGVSQQATLDDHVQGLLNVRDRALLIPGPDTRVTPDADLSAYDVGDTVDYQLHSQLGVGGAFRLRKRQIKVSKTGQETVSVAFV